jgi:hypothetical protein
MPEDTLETVVMPLFAGSLLIPALPCKQKRNLFADVKLGIRN